MIATGTGIASATAPGNGQVTISYDPGTDACPHATPTLSWTSPAAITYGTALSSTQLNASATDPMTGNTVPGTLTYTPAAGMVLSAGSGQSLSVTFTPTDSIAYTSTRREHRSPSTRRHYRQRPIAHRVLRCHPRELHRNLHTARERTDHAGDPGDMHHDRV